jgi:hypothetical protein
MKKNKNSVDIALVSIRSNADVCYILNCEQEFKYTDREQSKKHKALPTDHNENCESNTKISKQLFFKVIKPVLEDMFKRKGFKITTEVKDKTISERHYQPGINFKRDLDIIRIEWCVDKFFNDLKQTATEMELQLTA